MTVHHAKGYFIEDGRLWKLGGATTTWAVSCRECVTKKEATQLASLDALMEDGRSHFDCNEVWDYCRSIRTKHHVVAAFAPWLNGTSKRLQWDTPQCAQATMCPWPLAKMTMNA
jgi:hypothetical protein